MPDDIEEIYRQPVATKTTMVMYLEKGTRNAHIGRRAVAAARCRGREPEGRQWQIDVCHAHYRGAA
jgi:hypothetical protein